MSSELAKHLLYLLIIKVLINKMLTIIYIFVLNRRDGVVVRASASLSIDIGFISPGRVISKTFKNGIHSFPAWRLAQKG